MRDSYCDGLSSFHPAEGRCDSKLELVETIAKVRTSGTLTARTHAALRLAELTSRIEPNEMDDKTLADLVSLLDTWDDSVRIGIAVALGNLGPRAKSAAPKLVEILPEVDCLWVDASSALDIRNALERIGVPPPPLPKCETGIDPVIWKQRLKDTIAKVRTSDDPVSRGRAAVRIGYLIFWLGPDQIDDATIADLVSH